jgi:hypothetical protein
VGVKPNHGDIVSEFLLPAGVTMQCAWGSGPSGILEKIKKQSDYLLRTFHRHEVSGLD